LVRLGAERASEIAARGRAGKALRMAARTPEERSAITRATGAVSRRRNASEDFARMGQLGEQVMRERGYKHSAEARAAISERVRRTGQSAAGARAAHAKYGDEHPGVLALRDVATAKQNGVWHPCAFTDCPRVEDLIYQRKAEVRRGKHRYHLECRIAWMRSLPQREYIGAHRAITWILKRVSNSGDAILLKDVRGRAATQRDDLRRAARGLPRAARRPSTLLRDRQLAINAAILHDDVDLPVREIGVMMGFTLSTDQRGHESQARQAWNLIRLGRTLRKPASRAGARWKHAPRPEQTPKNKHER
jgi:hypothetical protein